MSNTCNTCGSIFPDDWAKPVRCPHTHRGRDYRKPLAKVVSGTMANPWKLIHSRIAGYLKKPSKQWNPVEQKEWHDSVFVPSIPNFGGCGCSSNWAPIADSIDWSTPMSAFSSVHAGHNRVSVEHAGNQPIPLEQAIKLWTGPSVGFLSVAYSPIGGTESLHRMLIPRLRHFRDIAEFVATGFPGGDGALLKVPYSTGIEAARELASNVDIVVTWGIDCLRDILPENRPKVVSVHHTDWSSEWSNNLTLNQLDLIDSIICVNEDVANRISACGKPSHYIPNALDPERIRPSGNQSGLRSQFGIPEESKIVLFGHRLSDEKRPALAIEIAKLLPDDWVMVITGDGPLKSAVESLASGLDRVRVVGRSESLADWLSLSSCFLSLSVFEGFGLAIGEAMLAGVPTVSTAAGIAAGLAITLPTESTAREWASAIVNSGSWVQPAGIADRFSVDKMVSAWAEVLRF